VSAAAATGWAFDAPWRTKQLPTTDGRSRRWLRYPDPAAHDDVVYTFKINTRGRSAKQPKAPLPYSAIERARDCRLKTSTTAVARKG